MKRIVWDFDGTLVDSRPLIEAGMHHTLGGLGLAGRPDLEAAWMRAVGLPVEAGLSQTFSGVEVDLAEVLKVYRAFDWLAHEHLLQPFPGMAGLLAELRGRGVAMAIASSKRGVPLRRQIAGLGWAGWFEPIITPDEVIHGKPHPESLHKVLEACGERPEDLVMVGDTPSDLDMARQAGVPAVGIGHGFYAAEALQACAPRAYAADVPALRDILLAWSEP